MVPVGLQGGHPWGHQLEGVYRPGLVDTQLVDPVIMALRHRNMEVNIVRKAWYAGHGGSLSLKRSEKLLKGKS